MEEKAKELIKQAIQTDLPFDIGKALAAGALKLPEGIKHAIVPTILGAASGAALGEQAQILSGNSGIIRGAQTGALNSAITGTLAGTALEILKDKDLRNTKEGKVAAALAAAISLAMAFRQTTNIMTDTIEKEGCWRTTVLKRY